MLLGVAVVPAGLKGGARAEASEWLSQAPSAPLPLAGPHQEPWGGGRPGQRELGPVLLGPGRPLSAAASPFVSCCADGSVGGLVRAS